MSHIEVISDRWSLLEMPGKHVLPIVWVAPTIKGLFSAVIEAGNASRGVKERQRHLQARRVVVGVARAEEARLIVIIQKRHQPHRRCRVIIGRNGVVVVLDLFGIARRGGKDTVNRKIKRVIQH